MWLFPGKNKRVCFDKGKNIDRMLKYFKNKNDEEKQNDYYR